MVMPVRACISSSVSMLRGATWPISSMTTIVLRVGRNSSDSTALKKVSRAKVRAIPEGWRSLACLQAVEMPISSRPPASKRVSAFHAVTRGFSKVDLPEPATPVRSVIALPLPSA